MLCVNLVASIHAHTSAVYTDYTHGVIDMCGTQFSALLVSSATMLVVEMLHQTMHVIRLLIKFIDLTSSFNCIRINFPGEKVQLLQSPRTASA